MSEGISYHRERDFTIGFRVTPEERRNIEARVKASGLTRGDYFRETFNNQQISIRIGKYESDRLSIEIKRLRIALENALSIGDADSVEIVKECMAVMNEMIAIMNSKKVPDAANIKDN